VLAARLSRYLSIAKQDRLPNRGWSTRVWNLLRKFCSVGLSA